MTLEGLAVIIVLSVGLPLAFICALASLVVIGEFRRRQRTDTDDDDWRWSE